MSLSENLLLLEQHFIFFKTPYIQRKGKGGGENKRDNALLSKSSALEVGTPLLLHGRATGAASLETCSYDTPLGTIHGPPQTERAWTGMWAPGSPHDGPAASASRKHLCCEAIVFCNTHCYTPQLRSGFNPDDRSRAANDWAQLREESGLIPTAQLHLFLKKHVSLISFDLHKIYFLFIYLWIQQKSRYWKCPTS